MNTIDLNVQGMTCGACVQRITAALMPIDGVQEVAVDLKTGRVRVKSEAKVAPSQLIAALSARRYESELSTESAPVGTADVPPAWAAVRKGGCGCG
jgi:copper chaperone